MNRVAVLLLLLIAPVTMTRAAGTSTVIIAHDPCVVTQRTVDPDRARRLVAAGILTLTGSNNPATAWRVFVTANDVVGIKINTQAVPLHGTHRAVVDAVIEGLRSAGVPARNIHVFDRDAEQLRAAGYPDATAIVGDTGWDAAQFYENKFVGKLIWGDLRFGQPGAELDTRSHLPRLLTGAITRLINIPVLQDHDACGIAGSLYNLSLGMVDNARRFEMFGQSGDPAIAEIAALPAIRGKTILHIMDALIGGYAGGPVFKPQYSWSPGRLYFSADPVAVDTLALELIEAKRREANIAAIGSRASHIGSAARLGLGQAERSAIRLVTATGSGDAREDDKKQ